MKTVIALIGMPGVGKSTIMKEFMSQWEWTYNRTGLIDHYLSGDLVVIGRYDDGEVFGGTDKLSMSSQPEALEFVKSNPDKIILFEGDRLGTKSFFRGILDAGYDLHIIHVIALSNLMDGRYEERGSDQDPVWLAGRETKIKNIVEEFGPQMTLFGEEMGYITHLANNDMDDLQEVVDHIQYVINEKILDEVVADL